MEKRRGEEWKKQLQGLKIPYPKKNELIREIADHISNSPEEMHQTFSHENLTDLYAIHNTRLLQWLELLPKNFRLFTESILSVAPILVLAVYLIKEDFMLNFVSQGGAGMWVILIVGALLVAKEVLLLFRLFIAKDHSYKNLSPDSTAVVVGAMVMVLLGMASAALGAYYTANSFIKIAAAPFDILVAGLSESITCFVVGVSIAAMILLVHLFTRQRLHSWNSQS